MAAPAYSKEEISALRGIFALYDPDGTGEISSADLESLLQKIGLKQEAARERVVAMLVAARSGKLKREV